MGEFHAKELKEKLLTFTDDFDLEVMDGKANIEVRPRFVNKGEIVKRLVWHQHGQPQDMLKGISEKLPKDQMPDFVLCLGDDFTDEDMFRQLNTIESCWKKNTQMRKINGAILGFTQSPLGPHLKKLSLRLI